MLTRKSKSWRSLFIAPSPLDGTSRPTPLAGRRGPAPPILGPEATGTSEAGSADVCKAEAMQPIDRRTFIADLGRGAFALAVVGLAACSPGR